jgi:RNA polymerase sigma-70 factor (ECF subfamily)
MTDEAETDESLVSRFARGDAAAFEQLYERHERRVWRYLQRNVDNRATADELMQETWFAVARDAVNFVPTARFTSWLFAIAHHRMIDSIRATRPHASLEVLGYEAAAVVTQLTAEPGAGPLAATIERDERKALLGAIEQLPAEQREAFLLQVEGGLAVEEIASVTDVSFETAKSRLRYARSKLREVLQEFA